MNCATIPKDLAERLLFGSRRGAYSGATDTGGHVQAAHGGTLFLDEVAELPADVQSKLLRLVHIEGIELERARGSDFEVVSYLKRANPKLFQSLRKAASGRTPGSSGRRSPPPT